MIFTFSISCCSFFKPVYFEQACKFHGKNERKVLRVRRWAGPLCCIYPMTSLLFCNTRGSVTVAENKPRFDQRYLKPRRVRTGEGRRCVCSWLSRILPRKNHFLHLNRRSLEETVCRLLHGDWSMCFVSALTTLRLSLLRHFKLKSHQICFFIKFGQNKTQ